MRSCPARLAVLLWLMLPACAGPGGPPKLLSSAAVVLPLPVMDHDRLYECGLVSVGSLCRYYGIAVPDDLRDALVVVAQEREGLSGSELDSALRSLGMDVWVFTGTLDRAPTGLLRQVDAGRPALVMTGEGDDRHYALFIGYDESLGTVCLLDPTRGQIVLPMGAFERTWAEAHRFTLLAVPAALSASATAAVVPPVVPAVETPP